MAQKKQDSKKPIASKYDEKLALNGTFLDVFKVIKKDREEKLKEKLGKNKGSKNCDK